MFALDFKLDLFTEVMLKRSTTHLAKLMLISIQKRKCETWMQICMGDTVWCIAWEKRQAGKGKGKKLCT